MEDRGRMEQFRAIDRLHPDVFIQGPDEDTNKIREVLISCGQVRVDGIHAEKFDWLHVTEGVSREEVVALVKGRNVLDPLRLIVLPKALCSKVDDLFVNVEALVGFGEGADFSSFYRALLEGRTADSACQVSGFECYGAGYSYPGIVQQEWMMVGPLQVVQSTVRPSRAEWRMRPIGANHCMIEDGDSGCFLDHSSGQWSHDTCNGWPIRENFVYRSVCLTQTDSTLMLFEA